jgi:hypothetical protein
VLLRSICLSVDIPYNTDMVTLKAHFDGKMIVPDEPLPVSLQTGARLKVNIETIDEAAPVAPVPQPFQPLNIHIAPELSNAIALDPEFNIEES